MANQNLVARAPEPMNLFAPPAVPIRADLAADVVVAEVSVQLEAVSRALEQLANARKVSQEALQLVMKI